MTVEDTSKEELRVVILGSSQKSALFEKLCSAADEYERHVHYGDVHYLTVKKNEEEQIMEFTDPGMARTGGREMAIRRADCAILLYSSLSTTTYNQLSKLLPDFQLKKQQIPIRLVCDSDEIVDEEEDESSTGISSVSEGYESDTDVTERLPRRASMEKIRRAHEDGHVTKEQGEELAVQFGNKCHFQSISLSTFTDARTMLEELLVEALESKKKKSTRRKFIKIGSKSRDSSSSTKSEKTPKKQPSEDHSSESGRPQSRSKNSQSNSKVCVIM